MADATQLPASAGAAGRGSRVVLPGQTPEGGYILSVLVKRTFDIVAGGACVLAEEDAPLVPGDVHWDDPMNSSVRYESDFVPYKGATDVVLNGVVHAPGGAPTHACHAALQVGSRRRVIQVIGDRVARYTGATPVFTDPAPFKTMEMRYERAYGGTDVFSDPKSPFPYPRNPLGRGFVVTNTAQTVEHLQLPNLEDPAALLSPESLCLGTYAAWEQRPMPAAFGWFPKTWQPRALLAGIMPADRPVEQELRKAYAELLSGKDREAYLAHGIRDMDFRFFNGGPVLYEAEPLRGGEVVTAENVTPSGHVQFRLPEERPVIGLDIGSGLQAPEVVLQTVMIRMEERQLDLVWRGAVPYEGPAWLPQMQKLDVVID